MTWCIAYFRSINVELWAAAEIHSIWPASVRGEVGVGVVLPSRKRVQEHGEDSFVRVGSAAAT